MPQSTSNDQQEAAEALVGLLGCQAASDATLRDSEPAKAKPVHEETDYIQKERVDGKHATVEKSHVHRARIRGGTSGANTANLQVKIKDEKPRIKRSMEESASTSKKKGRRDRRPPPQGDPITEIKKCDVKFGVGKGSYQHPGNVALREYIHERGDEWRDAPSNGAKNQISRAIYDWVSQQGGRFLEQVEEKWYITHAQTARDKISMTFTRFNRMKKRNQEAGTLKTPPKPWIDVDIKTEDENDTSDDNEVSMVVNELTLPPTNASIASKEATSMKSSVSAGAIEDTRSPEISKIESFVNDSMLRRMMEDMRFTGNQLSTIGRYTQSQQQMHQERQLVGNLSFLPFHPELAFMPSLSNIYRNVQKPVGLPSNIHRNVQKPVGLPSKTSPAILLPRPANFPAQNITPRPVPFRVQASTSTPASVGSQGAVPNNGSSSGLLFTPSTNWQAMLAPRPPPSSVSPQSSIWPWSPSPAAVSGRASPRRKGAASPSGRRERRTVPSVKVFVGEPEDNDVKLGKGSGSYKHAGNMALRQRAETLKTRYKYADIQTKTKIKHELIHWVQNEQNGRFLEYDSENGLWYMASEGTVKDLVVVLLGRARKS